MTCMYSRMCVGNADTAWLCGEAAAEQQAVAGLAHVLTSQGCTALPSFAFTAALHGGLCGATGTRSMEQEQLRFHTQGGW